MFLNTAGGVFVLPEIGISGAKLAMLIFMNVNNVPQEDRYFSGDGSKRNLCFITVKNVTRNKDTDMHKKGTTRTAYFSGHPEGGTGGPPPLLRSPGLGLRADVWLTQLICLWISIRCSCPGPFQDMARHGNGANKTLTRRHTNPQEHGTSHPWTNWTVRT